jgi:hypothetical protein
MYVSAIESMEIQITVPISMKFGTVEDHDPGMVFIVCLKKSVPRPGLPRPENLSWQNYKLKENLKKLEL